ncbi:MAG TPA: sigma 54-interacting transcriptional regulator [Clostridia bacterium]|nr:sigma 54-interacting transcriptional regulator [Clostridia bacterium]
MLKSIIDFAQKCAETISVILNVEVTIIDYNLTRIAGTAGYKNTIGQQLHDRTYTSRVVQSGKGCVIESPESKNTCINCGNRFNCPEKDKEKGLISVPIIDSGKVLGAISLICLNDIQLEMLISKKQSLMDFLTNIGQMLASKIKEQEYIDRLELNSSQLNQIFSSISDGLMLIDNKGTILNASQSVLNLTGNPKNSFLGMNIKDVIEDNMNIEEFKNSNNIEFTEVKFKNGSESFQCSFSPITINDKFEGAVMVLVEDIKLNPLIYKKVHANQRITFNNIIGESRLIKDTINVAIKTSKVKSNLLITGESGTGKELFARAIHNCMFDGSAPFIPVNCAAIPESLLESELFGYESGSFTGARKMGKPGKFELANGGTFFMDEIGDIPLHLQAKLLRVLQENEVERIGGTHPIQIDVRVIAATNKNLEQMVNSKLFREDLYYRLNVINLRLPPLRERKSDIPLLIEFFMNLYCSKMGVPKKSLDEEAIEALCNHEWKGNVRELQNIIEYICCICLGERVTYNDIKDKIERSDKMDMPLNINSLDFLEKNEIIKALNKYGYTTKGKVMAANVLSISRASLYRKLKEYNINSQNKTDF